MEDVRIELIKMLTPYSNWFEREDEAKQREAKEVLIRYYEKLKSIKPDEFYKDCGGGLHTFYVFYLLHIRKNLIEEDYVESCNILINTMSRSPFFQSRIMYNVIELLADYLYLGGKESV